MVPYFEYSNYVIHSNNDICPAFFSLSQDTYYTQDIS